MFCRFLPELPSPPPRLLETIRWDERPANPVVLTDSVSYPDDYEWIVPMPANGNVRRRFDEPWLKWVRENVAREFWEKNSGLMFFDRDQAPHTDTTRKYVLLYNLRVGGPDARLCFWRERGYPLQRDPMTRTTRGDHLELLEEITGPADVWYLMRTDVIHSVEGRTAPRVNLQVSFKDCPAVSRLQISDMMIPATISPILGRLPD
jgi:hypothetical protein